MFQRFLSPKSSEIVVDLKGQSERIHLFVTFPALGLSSFLFEPIPQGTMVIFGNLRIHRDGEIGNPSREQFLANPFSPPHRIGVEIGGMGNEPGGVCQQPLAFLDAKRLLHRIIPELRIVGKSLKILSLGRAIPKRVRGRWEVVEGGVIVVVAVRKGGGGEGSSPLANRLFEKIHVAKEFTALLTAENSQRLFRLNEFEVRLDDFLRLLLPVRVLQFVIGLRPLLDDLLSRFVVLVVIDKKHLRRQKILEDILILLEIPIDDPVRFLDEKSRCAHRASRGILVETVAALDVLEDLGGPGVAEKFPEKSHQLRV